MLDVTKTRRWFERLGLEDKTYRAYPGVGHSLDFAPDRAEYLADLLGWLRARVTSGSPRRRGRSLKPSVTELELFALDLLLKIVFGMPPPHVASMNGS